jgi:hypothetical protein
MFLSQAKPCKIHVNIERNSCQLIIPISRKSLLSTRIIALNITRFAQIPLKPLQPLLCPPAYFLCNYIYSRSQKKLCSADSILAGTEWLTGHFTSWRLSSARHSRVPLYSGTASSDNAADGSLRLAGRVKTFWRLLNRVGVTNGTRA